jgi:hypothetical protein
MRYKNIAKECRVIISVEEFNKLENPFVELSKFISGSEELKNNYHFKVYEKGVTTELEIQCFAFFYPLYLSMGPEYYAENFPNKKEIKQTTFSFRRHSLYPLMMENIYSDLNHLVENKFKQTLDLKGSYFEVLNKSGNWKLSTVKMIHNPKTLESHRQKFLEFIKHSDGKGDIPQHLISFHGTFPDYLDSIFEKGLVHTNGETSSGSSGFFGTGCYVTSYPQYSMHYSKFAMEKKSKEMLNSLKVVAGYFLPGKFEKLTEIKKGSEISENFDSRFVRTQFYFPSKSGKESEDSDEMVFKDSSQFYPCFEMEFERISNLKKQILIRSHTNPLLFLSIGKDSRVILSKEKKIWISTTDNHLSLDNQLSLDMNLKQGDISFGVGDLMIWKTLMANNQRWKFSDHKIYSCVDFKVIGISENGKLTMQDDEKVSKNQMWDFLEYTDFDFYIRCKSDPTLFFSYKDQIVTLSDSKVSWKWTIDNYLKMDKFVLDLNQKNDKTFKVGDLILWPALQGKENQKWKLKNNRIYSCIDSKVVGVSKLKLEMQEEEDSEFQLWDFIDSFGNIVDFEFPITTLK